MGIAMDTNWTTSTPWSNSTAGDQHNHTIYMDDYNSTKVKTTDQWYVYNDSDMKIGKLVELVDALWNTLRPYINNSRPEKTKDIEKMLQAIKEDNGYGMHYGHSTWPAKELEPEHLKELEDLFEI